jgi:hypothetical protein
MKFSHTRGQKEMLAELTQLSDYFENMDRELTLVQRKWGNAKGVTDDTIYQVMGDMLLSEIKDIDDDEAIKQVLNVVIHQILYDATSKKV